MPTNAHAPNGRFSFGDDDDEGGWQEMPVVKEDEFAGGLDEEDQKKYHYVPKKSAAASSSRGGTGNATGNLIDFDDDGVEWRSKAEQNENEYTRLRVEEEDEGDEVHLRTRYLFDEDKAMTPLSQMQTTKNMLTEAQRIAYVGHSIQSMELWALKIMGRLYYHMELETAEQKMIDSLALHGLMTTHTIANPEYDPVEAKKQEISDPSTAHPTPSRSPTPTSTTFQTTARVLENTSVASSSLSGVTTTLSSVDKDVTLDIRWTVLCDLFLVLIADSVYDARSRVLLEHVALKLGLGWIDVVKFEARVTEALEIQEGVEKLENQEIIDGSSQAARKKRYMMMGLATLGGGLVIGLSAGLLAPVIGAGLGAAFATVGISGTTGFLAGAGGAAVITTGGVLTGSGIAARGMAKRTQSVRTFDVLPLHNNKRVSCILTVPGFMSGKLDDVRLPFSVLDPIVGDVFSVLWEPEMIQETGSALKILTGEILTQIGQTVLHHTAMTALMGALQWPIILTKLGYLIDNPWNNALDRARAAGSVLARLLMQRHLGVRPITLIGFSLGSRVIFYALVELANAKAFGIVQDVFILGATLTASRSTWCSARSVVSGRFVNVYAKNDWVLNYLFRATSGGLSSVAGLGPVDGVPGVENVDVTDKIAGHMSYRTFMPLILDQLGFPVSADFFDEPVEPDFTEDRVVIRDEEQESQKKGWFSRGKKKTSLSPLSASRPPSAPSLGSSRRRPSNLSESPSPPAADASPEVPVHAGFDLAAMKEMIGEVERHPEQTVAHPSLAPSRKAHGMVKPVPYDEDADVAGPSSFSMLSTTFATSLSLQDRDPYRRAEEDDLETRAPANGFAFSNASSYTPTIPLHEEPQISFGGSDGSIWTAPIGVGSASSSAFGNPFARSTDLSFGNAEPTAHPLGTYPTSPALSFGSPDGTITFQGLEASADPWGAPSEPRKMTGAGFSSNPWST
ncbi:hypothetical protein BU15DRAFT_88891 [Melanogaster broomeanus]|nr:hypothetical protein BU15DRAFT_88891 [Melanogaster broomeanus]